MTLAPEGPCAFVVFGITGDLTKRLLIPAIHNLAAGGLLPARFTIVGVGRTDMTDTAFQSYLEKNLQTFATTPVTPETARRLFSNATYVRGDFGDPGTYRRLAERLGQIELTSHGGNRLFYLATPPTVFSLIVSHLSASGLTTEEGPWWRRVVVEKPFGTSLDSARELNRQLLEKLSEHQIYRIDHYLGKETVQNLMVLRFANGLFEPIWNRHHVDHVQITVAEQVTVETRGDYYDATGALRDMVPNHLFQLLSLTAMEPPADFSADAVRSEKTKVLDSVQPFTRQAIGRSVVRAQYRAGEIKGRAIPDYRREPKVKSDSLTETYVALRLMIDNWRWAGVPFYLRTGKALAGRRTEVAIKFRQAPFTLFRDTPVERLAENFLVLRIQPDEGASIQFNAKVPGQELAIRGVRMDFHYADYFKAGPSTGYETLLYDCLIGDATLFLRADNVEAGWRVVQPILDAVRESPGNGLAFYDAGSQGPAEADALLEHDARHWRPIR
ncbi:MAG TPA: glucose-6-phosphate dehydrogenase [Hyphomicrobiaceae bacterium]|nr:glucose-6-phosphate dehydrogenase [Hyphomicrobiaceae bacterium]